MTPPLALAVPPAPLAAAATPRLQALKWRARVVLAFAPSAADPRLGGQRAALQSLTQGPDTRDLVYVEVAGEQVAGLGDAAEALRRRFGAAPDRFQAVLVGKDGGVKLRASAPIPAASLAATIDAMPMRREEVRR